MAAKEVAAAAVRTAGQAAFSGMAASTPTAVERRHVTVPMVAEASSGVCCRLAKAAGKERDEAEAAVAAAVGVSPKHHLLVAYAALFYIWQGACFGHLGLVLFGVSSAAPRYRVASVCKLKVDKCRVR